MVGSVSTGWRRAWRDERRTAIVNLDARAYGFRNLKLRAGCWQPRGNRLATNSLPRVRERTDLQIKNLRALLPVLVANAKYGRTVMYLPTTFLFCIFYR